MVSWRAGMGSLGQCHAAGTGEAGRREDGQPGLSLRASWLVATALAAAHWIVAVIASRHNATTFDEVAHIAGGMGMVKYRDYRLNPENGVLPQLLAGSAIVASGGRFPDVDSPHTLEGLSWQHSDSWELGYQALYLVGNEASHMLLVGRAAVALSGFGAVLLVHGMARYVHDGDSTASLLSTVLAAACPTFLAHGPLITSDGVFTFTASLATASIWSMLNAAADAAGASHLSSPPAAARPRAGWRTCCAWALSTGVAVGLVVTAKHSGVIIAPIAVVLLALRTWRVPGRRLPRFALLVTVCVVASVSAMLTTIWWLYGFRYTAFAHLDCNQVSL